MGLSKIFNYFSAEARRQRELDRQILRYAERGYRNLLEDPLKWGGDPNARDMFGNTALMVAVKRGEPDCINLLADTGAVLNLSNIFGTTAKDIAARKINPSVKELLAKIDTPEWLNERLLIAADATNIKAVKSLLQRGADPGGMDSSGKTPLMKAMSSYKDEKDILETVEILLVNGADITRGNTSVGFSNGYNGVDYVRLFARGAVKELLEKEIDRVNLTQKTPATTPAIPAVAAEDPEDFSPALKRNLRLPKPIFPQKKGGFSSLFG